MTAEAISPAGDWLSISVPASTANKLFDADFDVYTHTASGKQAIRTLSYSIPTDLVGHLEFVHPTISYVVSIVRSRWKFIHSYDSFPNPDFHSTVVTHSSPARRENERRGICSGSAITPTCVQSLYSVPNTRGSQMSNSIGVAGFTEEYANRADLSVSLASLEVQNDAC